MDTAFTALGLNDRIAYGVQQMGYEAPTPIQAQAIPPAMLGKDVLACAMTGSGKTAAFVLPMLEHLRTKSRGVTRALVLAPTRELAAQIHEHLEELAVHTPVTGAPVFGGVGMEPQEHAFRSGVDVIIATPGRLLDHFTRPYAKLDRLEYLVIDEADRMLDMGFLPDIRKVLRHITAKRQTLFFSATLPPEIVRLAGELLRQPVTLNLERKAAPAVGITQAVYPVSQELKGELILTLLNNGAMKEALVFTRTKHRANRLADFLVKKGINADRIHGNRSQQQRTKALEGFKDGDIRVLVATDIAARGIDVEALGHVVNFDVPNVPDDYIHRVGRTARAELTGEAYTFVSPAEEEELRAIERAISKRLPRVILPDFNYQQKVETKLEIPLAERIAVIRAKKAEDRARAAAKLARRGMPSAPSGGRPSSRPGARPQGKPAPRAGDASPYASGSEGPSRGGSAGGSGRDSRRRPRGGGRDGGRGGPSRGSRG